MRKENPTIILGIDPGTRITGYALLQVEGNKIVPLDFGCIRTDSKKQASDKYLTIFEAIEVLIDRYQPSAMAIETQFVQKNPQSALKLGMARGAAILAGAKRRIAIFEYAPKKAKMAVVGHGGASKHQVQKMMQMLLGLSQPPHPEDAADALAIAFCHANQLAFLNRR